MSSYRTEWDRLDREADRIGIRELAAIIARQQEQRDDLLRRLAEALGQVAGCRERLARLEARQRTDGQGG